VPSVATLRSSMFIGPMSAERTAAREARAGSAGRAAPRPFASTARRFPIGAGSPRLNQSSICGVAPGAKCPGHLVAGISIGRQPKPFTKAVIKGNQIGHPVYGYTSIFENR
jgi:hypothetical protein